jgi:protein SCO1/2
MIERYVTPAEFKRLVSALLVVAVFISIVGLFAFLVVPGMRNVNEPGSDTAVTAVQGDTGWLDPTDYPAAARQVIPPVDPKTVLTPTPELIARGKTLFSQTCSACHGPEGRGDGPAGANLTPKPRNVTEKDGWKNGTRIEDIFKTLHEGIKGTAMVPYDYLTKKDRMALVHVVQSLGDYDHGTSDPQARADLERLFASAGEVIPNRIPVARAINILVKEARQEPPPPPGRDDPSQDAPEHGPSIGGPAEPQQRSDPSPTFTAQEVGIDEKLGETLPLDLVLHDEDGKEVSLRSLIDKPTLLTLNYFRCAGICTPQLNAVARVANLTEAVPGRDFQILTVSFDDRDTPEIAAEKRTNYLGEIKRPFPPSAWRFLTGDAATTKKLADAVGFHFKRMGDDFVHAAAIIFIGPKGSVTRYMYGVTYLPADVQMAALEAARNETRPTIAKFLSFCFGYDPQGRRLVLTITSVAATVTVVAAVIFAVFISRRGRGKKPMPKERA